MEFYKELRKTILFSKCSALQVFPAVTMVDGLPPAESKRLHKKMKLIPGKFDENDVEPYIQNVQEKSGCRDLNSRIQLKK